MTLEEFKSLSLEAKKKWLTEYKFQRQKYEIETYQDYSVLHYHIKEEVSRMADVDEELLIEEVTEELEYFPKFKDLVNLMENN